MHPSASERRNRPPAILIGTGHCPADNPFGAAHLAEAPTPIEQRRLDIPAALAALVMRCLAKDPADRPQSADELAAALADPEVISGAFASSPALDAARPRESTRGWRWRVIAPAAPVVLLFVAGAAALLASRAQPAAPLAASLAVLPMVYVGDDDSRAYLAEGVTSAVTSALGAVPGLRVASANAAVALQQRLARGEPVADAVTTFLEGVIQQEGDQLRIDARLVSAADGFMVWAGSYEGTQGELVALQHRMRESVVSSVSERVQPTTK